MGRQSEPRNCFENVSLSCRIARDTPQSGGVINWLESKSYFVLSQQTQRVKNPVLVPSERRICGSRRVQKPQELLLTDCVNRVP
jgi:hypothetical protein